MLSQAQVCLLLSLYPSIGPVLFHRLLAEGYSDPDKIANLPYEDLAGVVGHRKAELFLKAKKEFDPDNEIKRLKQKGIGFIAYTDDNYPLPLKHISDPPIGLFYKGKWESVNWNNPAIAVVGSRKPTRYGCANAYSFSHALAKNKIIIVSGMALGVDAASHEGALFAEGTTIAVLGCGVDIIYPPENRVLYQKLTDKGIVISEFPPGTYVRRGFFVTRNRIIAGLCRGVFIVEGAAHSGSLITARYALKEGRDVFALPGQVGVEQSEAPNMLIKEGAAQLVTSPADIATSLGISIKKHKEIFKKNNIPPSAQALMKILSKGPLTTEGLLIETGLVLGDLQQILMTLEVKGIIVKTHSGLWEVQ